MAQSWRLLKNRLKSLIMMMTLRLSRLSMTAHRSAVCITSSAGLRCNFLVLRYSRSLVYIVYDPLDFSGTITCIVDNADLLYLLRILVTSAKPEKWPAPYLRDQSDDDPPINFPSSRLSIYSKYLKSYCHVSTREHFRAAGGAESNHCCTILQCMMKLLHQPGKSISWNSGICQRKDSDLSCVQYMCQICRLDRHVMSCWHWEWRSACCMLAYQWAASCSSIGFQQDFP